MKAAITIDDTLYEVDFMYPLDLSLPLVADEFSSKCFYAPMLEIEPVKSGSFTGSIEAGAPVNFMNLKINIHGNGTHTECVGHIYRGDFLMSNWLQQFHFPCRLISVYPLKTNSGDRIITVELLKNVINKEEITPALAIRTLPNTDDKLGRNYSGTNPPYFEKAAMEWLVDAGVEHLLTDLPSVDRESDGGKLLAHHAFWFKEGSLRQSCTITELIYASNEINDGLFLLNLQFLRLGMDASPSRPVLFALQAI